ncbi:hypothetical protein NIES2135_68050 (plasmid) [Leptolyngbya boryana NIES-2135]|jgi:hypothetical protein|uniref:Uncharacterized protein n=1 Tax=Leptolyngbya boryana NIES-2135 TaxID=1973484 RepID=A0A1Z4JTG5_LEPBY|nr:MULTISPECIES: hypothetical protein [Leptolyngbya]BAY59928.1 hypothetical protein NIES2135_68050 [Leptolyngbya boryana NIES-2135]MBD2371508.1 hypothetical protein [Leptolyngbya sp. FACHB-161]MBD2378047.1 hypothetical protein [Leptolyngbya sp. FACHB-238]MBD2402492.1 hypothetical protein [Leptolyngbya sp. FACHB-239]MBD2408979.1 hypothetical protein [Leptolyngbya sp. FACHB-402]
MFEAPNKFRLRQSNFSELNLSEAQLLAVILINRPFQKNTSVTAPGFDRDLTRIVAERNHAGLQQFLSEMNNQH